MDLASFQAANSPLNQSFAVQLIEKEEGRPWPPPALEAPCLLIVVPITFYPQTQGEIAYASELGAGFRFQGNTVRAGLPQSVEGLAVT